MKFRQLQSSASPSLIVVASMSLLTSDAFQLAVNTHLMGRDTLGKMIGLGKNKFTDNYSMTSMNMIASISRSSDQQRNENMQNVYSDIDQALSQQSTDLLQKQRTRRRVDGNQGPASSTVDTSVSGTSGPKEQTDFMNDIHTILDDGHGHINAELAQSIWNWENSQRLSQENEVVTSTLSDKKQYPASKLQYSTREGLRLVDSIARDLIDTSSSYRGYNDLVQEGVITLMKSMAEIHDDEIASTLDMISPQVFETYAKKKIAKAMTQTMADVGASGRPIRAQEDVLDTLASQKERHDKSDKKRQVSSKHWAQDDESSLSQEKMVAPLRDFMEDENPTPEEIALNDMILHDISEFLERTLDERELMVIRLRFGLTSEVSAESSVVSTRTESSSDRSGESTTTVGSTMTLEDIGSQLNVSRQRVAQIQQRALEKLRTSFNNDYIGVYLDDDHAEEVSV